MNTRRKHLTTVCFPLIVLLTQPWHSFPQTRPQKPALIRDTDVAEGKEEVPENKEMKYSPMLAEKNVTVGNFYMKRKNYVAAIERYREAIEYQPNHVEAYQALVRAYERNGEKAKAAQVCRDFIQKYPESPKVRDFQAKLPKLENK